MNDARAPHALAVGRLLADEGRAAEALSWFDQAIARAHMPKIRFQAENDRAVALMTLGRTAEAVDALRAVIDAAAPGIETPERLAILINLAAALVEEDRATEAQTYLTHAFDLATASQSIREEILVRGNRAAILATTGQLIPAEVLLKDAIALHQQRIQAEDADLAGLLASLADVMDALGKPADAATVRAAADAIMARQHGPADRAETARGTAAA